MFDANEYLNSLFNTDYSSTSTTVSDTDTATTNQTTYSPQTDYKSNYQTGYERDDYSSSQNFTEQSSYNSLNSTRFSDSIEQSSSVQMSAPVIEKSEKAVNLVKSQAKIRLETRMKIVLSVFSVIVACLLFVSVFNFVMVGKIQSKFEDKQSQIKTLEQDIKTVKNAYNSVNDEDFIKNWADTENYKAKVYESDVKDEINSYVVEIGEVYEESVVQEVPTNWFNDVCEFLSKLFA